MWFRWLAALVTLPLLAGCGSNQRGPGHSAGASTSLECAPFARQVSGIELYGDAAAWWDQAANRYERSQEPASGGVLVFRRSSRLPSGHVSVVSRVVSDREVRVVQANWVRYRITQDEPIIDVSPGNDWSQVRVWWEPSRVLGSTAYATYGFILPSRPRSDLVASLP